MRRIIPLGTVLAVGIAVAACSGSGATPSAPSSAAPSVGLSAEPSASNAGGGGGGEAVTIKGFAFAPAALSVKVGTTVTWTNRDNAPHTVTFDVGNDSSGDLANGATYSETFTTAGTFAYHCAIHPNMKATVTVTP